MQNQRVGRATATSAVAAVTIALAIAGALLSAGSAYAGYWMRSTCGMRARHGRHSGPHTSTSTRPWATSERNVSRVASMTPSKVPPMVGRPVVR